MPVSEGLLLGLPPESEIVGAGALGSNGPPPYICNSGQIKHTEVYDLVTDSKLIPFLPMLLHQQDIDFFPN